MKKGTEGQRHKGRKAKKEIQRLATDFTDCTDSKKEIQKEN